MSEPQEPFFGEEKKPEILEYGMGAVVSIWVVLTAILCVVYGIKDGIPEHFVAGFSMLAIFGLLVLLIVWYRQGDLDPKFKWLIVGLVFAVLLAGCVAQVYIWRPAPPSSQCANGLGFYQWNKGTCLVLSGPFDMCLNHTPHYCIRFTGKNMGVCQNCTKPILKPNL